MELYSKWKIESLLSEFHKYPSYGLVGAGIKQDDVALADSDKIIQIAQEILEVDKSISSHEKITSTEKDKVYWRFSEALIYRSRAYFEKFIFWSDTSSLYVISKKELFENFKDKGSNINSVYEIIKNLNLLLSNELQEYVAFPDMYLCIRCNCYRVLGDSEKAILDAKHIIQSINSRQNGYILLSQCYLDIRDYANAINASTEAIGAAVPNSIMEGVAWNLRAGIHKEIGDLNEAERDEKRYKEIIESHKK